MDRHHRYRCRNENPSFSSTLLDVISRSIDERDDRRNCRQSIDGCFQIADRCGDVRRKSATGFESNSFCLDSKIGSSASRYGGSSETETTYGFPTRPRPIRTNISHGDECDTPEMNRRIMYAQSEQSQPKANCEGRFVKTKSRAMKIYGYLKKGKQPISPGGRLASFLFSLFSSTNTKKSKIPSPYHDEAIVHANRKPKSAATSSSFSGSCLSKTPSSSRGKLTTDVKRSVKFYPASVIVNEYSQPLGHKSVIGDRSGPPVMRNSINGEFSKRLTEKNRHMEETILKNYQRKVEYVFDSIKNNVIDDDEAWSDASSDLFELDHLSSAIGCMQELPLYETTSVDANRAIANGLLLV